LRCSGSVARKSRQGRQRYNGNGNVKNAGWQPALLFKFAEAALEFPLLFCFLAGFQEIVAALGWFFCAWGFAGAACVCADTSTAIKAKIATVNERGRSIGRPAW